MAKVPNGVKSRNIAENFNRLSIGCTNVRLQTDNRQTDDRQTDGRRHGKKCIGILIAIKAANFSV